MSDEAIIELWQERSAIQQTDNIELLKHYRNESAPDWLVRRACELCAAADLAMQYGDYVCEVIQPLITKEPSSDSLCHATMDVQEKSAGGRGNVQPA